MSGLLQAIMRGRLDGVREELSSENVNYNDMNVGTPLYLAAKGGHANIVALLLTHENIRVNSVYDDKTPLFQAAKRGYTNIVTLLLAHKDILVNLGRYDQAPLSVALHNGHKDIAKLLILRDDIDVNRIKLGGRDALLWAASEGHADIVKLLLPKCNVNWEEKNRYIQRNRFNRFDQENGYNQRLVAAIMNLDDPDATTRFLMELSTRRPDRTPLSWAAENGYEILTRFLLFEEWANLNTRDNGGRTPLSRAAASGYRSVVELLLTKEDIDINARDCDGQTPLSQAAVNGYEEVVKLLLAKENIDVNTKDEHGQTPLSRVAGEGRQEIVQLFLMNERTSLNVRDVDGRTPLSLAAENGHEVIVELLLGKNAAKISKEEMKWKSEEEKFLLTRSGADPNIKDNGGQTPLSWAIDNGHKAIIKLLVPIDATTLFLLTQKGKRRAVKSLILAESNIDERNGHGQTPLHTAILSGHLEIAKDLILYGAEIDLQDNDNMTPLQLAMREKDDRFIQELLKHKADMKNIMAKEWRNAYGKESKDIVLLSETVNGERWVDFPTALPTANELSQAPFGINRHLYSFTEDSHHLLWSKVPIADSKEQLKPNELHFNMLKKIDDDSSDISVSLWFYTEHYLSSNPSSIPASSIYRIAWKMNRSTKPGSPWTPAIYFSTLPNGWLPENNLDLFTQFIFYVKASWLKLCQELETYLSNRRLEQLKCKGKNSNMIDLLANDARKLAELRGILHDQVRAAEKFVKDYCRYYNANKIPKGLLDVLADQFEIVVNKWIGRLDEVVRDLLQIEFAWVSINETRISTQLGQNVMLLTYVSIFYLPLGFCAALWAIPDITNSSTRNPFIFTSIFIGLVTLLITFNMERISGVVKRALQYGKDVTEANAAAENSQNGGQERVDGRNRGQRHTVEIV